MKKIFFLLFVIFSGFTLTKAEDNLTAIDLLKKTVALITNSKGTEAKFSISNSGYSGSGIIKSNGNKFNVKFPDAELWYNGNDLYTFNSRTNETTVILPTPEELAESNPLTYVTNAQNNYNVSFSTVKKTGKYVLELLPKKKGNIKRITLTLNKTNYRPEKIVVEPSSGTPVTAEITSFKTGIAIPQSDFEYPKVKFSKVEIIDLR